MFFSKSRLTQIIDIIVIAIIYYSTARLSQLLAIPPGNITPVWLPSGIILAVMMLRGYHIGVGIFLGAFVGNFWAYFDPNLLEKVPAQLFAGMSNGLGDSLGMIAAVYLIKRATKTNFPFTKVREVVYFIIYGAILSALISAFCGVTSLCISGLVVWDEYFIKWLTWWTGDSVGVLILAPLILAWFIKYPRHLHLVNYPKKSLYAEGISFIVVAILTSIYVLGLLPFKGDLKLPIFVLAPILLWPVFRLEERFTFSAIFIVSGLAITATYLDVGVFARYASNSLESEAASQNLLNLSMINLQLFIFVKTITIFIVQGVVSERETIQNNYKTLMNQLEDLVEERTQDLKKAYQELETAYTQVQELATTDPLTSVANRRALLEFAEEEFNRVKRYSKCFSILMIDIDYFKMINDTYGHDIGDKVLQMMAKTTSENLRKTDFFGRFGGEEFVAVLPETEMQEAITVAERIRFNVANVSVINDDHRIQITISIGVANYSNRDDTFDSILKRADQALYKAKQQGRNQVVYS